MLYFVLKYLHVIGACVLLGTGAGIAFFMLMAHRTDNASTIAGVARIVVVADFLFTALPILGAKDIGRHELSTGIKCRPDDFLQRVVTCQVALIRRDTVCLRPTPVTVDDIADMLWDDKIRH